MPEINHKLLKKHLTDLKSDSAGEFAAVYLIFGEELLVKNAFNELLTALLPAGNQSANYDPVEGTTIADAEVERMRADFGIYIVRGGRINVAGLTSANLDRVCDALAAVRLAPGAGG